MPTDYSKLKNVELEALLKERQLPHAGKKAEMVARLTEHDQLKETSSSTANGTTTAPAPAAGAASTEPAAAAIAAGGTGTRASNPVDVPNQAAAVDPSKTSDLIAAKDTTTSTAAPLADGAVEAKDGEGAAPAAPAFTSNLHLAPTDIDAEIAKRKARAAKFGISESENDAIKALERAKRFGTGTSGEKAAGEAADAGVSAGALGVSRLDVALPEREARKRGRGPVEGDSWDDEGLKRRRGGGGLRGRGGKGRRDRSRSGEAKEKTKVKGAPDWMSDADRAAAEKRKAKFGAAPSAS